MTFNSLQYALFLPLVVALHWALPRRARLPLLLAASYFFYGAWDYRFLSLLAISTVGDYFIALAMGRTDDERRGRLLLATSLVLNLGILAFFKYFNFFVDSAADLLGRAGLEPNMPLLRVVLPVGISFYTFQTLSYTFDVYRRRMEPCRDFISVATYVAFFPQLVAGPIERARHLLPQILAERRPPTLEQFQSAIGLIIFGLFKKVVLADQMAPIVERVFSSPDDSAAFEIVVACAAFSIQAYGDFSGYSDIARGSARLLSVDLMVNFAQPHLSRSISEFWRRWHMSLSGWLRDYLYVPLGGSHGSRFATHRNLILTMTLSGLWHGAGWTYVLWGVMQGVMLSVHRAFKGGDTDEDDRISLHDVPRIAATFGLIMLSWLFFRAASIEETLALAQNLFLWRGPTVVTAEALQVLVWLVLMFGIDMAHRAPAYDREIVSLRRPVFTGAMAGVGLTLIVLYSGSTAVPFIYFQF